MDTLPTIGNVLLSCNMQDRRNIIFWCMELAGGLAFAFWLMVAMRLSQNLLSYPLDTLYSSSLRLPMQRLLLDFNISSPEYATAETRNSTKILAGEVWFALAFTTVIDAFAVVANFNRVLLKQFHHVVNLRMMLLAAIISSGVLLWADKDVTLSLPHRLLFAAGGLLLYLFCGMILDSFRPPIPTKDACYHPSSLQLYAENLSQFDVSWRKAIYLTAVTGGAALMLTICVPPSLSGLTPILQIGFEVAGCLAMNNVNCSYANT